MPIPSPREGEKENEFINRCMEAVPEGEGDQKQRLAICYSKWREHKGSKSLADVRRILTTPIRQVEGHPGRVMSYAAIWGDEKHPDWYGTWFTRDTDFCLDWYNDRPWLYDHTMNQFVRTTKIGTWKDVDLDEHGLFFLGELDAHFHYLDEVQFLMELGYLFPSSGTLSHVMQVADDGWIQRWPIAELSSTPSPAEFRIPAQVDASSRRRAAEAIRKLGGLTMTQPTSVQDALFPSVAVPAPPPTDETETEPAARAIDSDVETETIEVEETEVEEPAATVPGEVEEAITAVELQTAVLSIDETLRELFEQVRSLRDENQELRSRLETLEVPPAQQVAQLVSDRNWTDRLFSATRSGRAITNQDAGVDGEPAAPLEQGAPLLAQLGTVGGTDGHLDVLGQIVASQRV